MEIHSDCMDTKSWGCEVFPQKRSYFPDTEYSHDIEVGKCFDEGCSRGDGGESTSLIQVAEQALLLVH